MISESRARTRLSLLSFPFYYCWAVIAGALRISWDVVHPRPRLRPVIVRIPLALSSPLQRLLLANLITMTPGTLSVDLLDDESTLVVHSLYDGDDPELLISTIQLRYLPVVSRLPI
jgi:multicomponent Na+:H+ antiporter subunit E